MVQTTRSLPSCVRSGTRGSALRESASRKASNSAAHRSRGRTNTSTRSCQQKTRPLPTKQRKRGTKADTSTAKSAGNNSTTGLSDSFFATRSLSSKDVRASYLVSAWRSLCWCDRSLQNCPSTRIATMILFEKFGHNTHASKQLRNQEPISYTGFMMPASELHQSCGVQIGEACTTTHRAERRNL